MNEKRRELVMLANLAPLATAKAEDLWRILLTMADAATPEGVISEEEWVGIARTVHALYRAEKNPRLRPGAVIEVQGVPCLVRRSRSTSGPRA